MILPMPQTGPRFQMQAPVLALTDLAVDGKSLFRGTAALGKLNASIGQFQFAAAGNRAQQLRVAVPQASVQGLNVVPSGGQTIALAAAALKDAALDGLARKLTIGSLALNGADLPLRRERDGQHQPDGLVAAQAGGFCACATKPCLECRCCSLVARKRGREVLRIAR